VTGASETDHLTRAPDGHTRANAATRLDLPERWRAMGCGGLSEAGAPGRARRRRAVGRVPLRRALTESSDAAVRSRRRGKRIAVSSPVIRKESLRAARLAQISKNPYITTFQARLLACEHNVQPNF